MAENDKRNGEAVKLQTPYTLKPHMIVEALNSAERKADHNFPPILHAHLKSGAAEVMVCDGTEEADVMVKSLAALKGTLGILLLGMDNTESHTQCRKGPTRSRKHDFGEQKGFFRGNGMGVILVHSTPPCKVIFRHPLHMGHFVCCGKMTMGNVLPLRSISEKGFVCIAIQNGSHWGSFARASRDYATEANHIDIYPRSYANSKRETAESKKRETTRLIEFVQQSNKSNSARTRTRPLR